MEKERASQVGTFPPRPRSATPRILFNPAGTILLFLHLPPALFPHLLLNLFSLFARSRRLWLSSSQRHTISCRDTCHARFIPLQIAHSGVSCPSFPSLLSARSSLVLSIHDQIQGPRPSAPILFFTTRPPRRHPCFCHNSTTSGSEYQAL